MSQNSLMDIRTVQRNIKRGKVSQEEYQKHLDSLEDCADEAEETETQMILHKADEDAAEA
tara:strand:- start:1100 stop:1279 length:180 start_codon:yes stop_codon:yes gene_type:complete